jgi:hypothetical protein
MENETVIIDAEAVEVVDTPTEEVVVEAAPEEVTPETTEEAGLVQENTCTSCEG